MQVETNQIVTFHYDVTTAEGVEVDSSRGRAPMSALLGHGNLIRGVEDALIGRQAGDHFTLDLAPEAAYGPVQEGLRQRVSKKYFRDPRRLRAGAQALLESRDGPRWVTVLKVGQSVVDVDLNHPLAGQTLHFVIDITAVRAATPEELEHGHAHGEGGHSH